MFGRDHRLGGMGIADWTLGYDFYSGTALFTSNEGALMACLPFRINSRIHSVFSAVQAVRKSFSGVKWPIKYASDGIRVLSLSYFLEASARNLAPCEAWFHKVQYIVFHAASLGT